jgi:hypothetical protein
MIDLSWAFTPRITGEMAHDADRVAVRCAEGRDEARGFLALAALYRIPPAWQQTDSWQLPHRSVDARSRRRLSISSCSRLADRSQIDHASGKPVSAAISTHPADQGSGVFRTYPVLPHVLRHTAMRLLAAGVDTTVIALWLGPNRSPRPRYTSTPTLPSRKKHSPARRRSTSGPDATSPRTPSWSSSSPCDYAARPPSGQPPRPIRHQTAPSA